MADREQAPSFLVRAVLAIVFVWSFRLLVLALAVGWATLPSWLPDSVPTGVRALAWIATVVTALGVVRALLYVPDQWRAPASALQREDHPELFTLVDEVSSALDTRAPDFVFLVPDANAWVRELHRFFGLRSERNLVLGTGLLATSTASELRATVAHELAHFVGGDTKLALAVARTRQGMLLLLEELHGGLFFRPVAFYAAFFLSLTQSSSRAQELWADRASVRIAGRAPHQASLRAAVVADVVLGRMLERGVPFLLACGYRPANVYPAMRAAADAPAPAARARIEEELHEKPAEAFDSHPPPDERIRAAEDMAEPEQVPVDDRPALALLGGDLEELEREQTAAMLRALQAPELPALPDDVDVVEHAIQPTLQKSAREAREHAGQLFGEEAAGDDERALRAYLGMAARSAAAADAAPDVRATAQMVRDMVAPGMGALLAVVEVARGGELAFDGVERPSVTRDGEQSWPFDDAGRAVVDPPYAAELLARLFPSSP